MEPIQLSEEQKKMLSWIERDGAVSPSRLAAQTKTLPQDTWDILYKLAEMRLVVMREDPDSPDGVLVLAAPAAAQTAQTAQTKKIQ